MTPNGKLYVGITKQKPNKRWMRGKGYQKQSYFYNAILKYGWDNISHLVLYDNLTKEDAEEKEKEFIRFFQTDDRRFGYNIEKGGHIGKVSDETREKLSRANTGKRHPPEVCEKLRLLEIERWKDEEYRRNQIEKRLGKTPWNKGKETSLETRAKQRDAKLGKYIGAEHWNSKKVVNLDTGQVFDSIGLVAKALGKKNGSKVVQACKGKRKTAHGYRWAYYEEVI